MEEIEKIDVRRLEAVGERKERWQILQQRKGVQVLE